MLAVDDDGEVTSAGGGSGAAARGAHPDGGSEARARRPARAGNGGGGSVASRRIQRESSLSPLDSAAWPPPMAGKVGKEIKEIFCSTPFPRCLNLLGPKIEPCPIYMDNDLC